MEPPKLGQVVHVEVVSKDPEATRKFFHAAFGLDYAPVPGMEMPYFMVQGDVRPGTGLRTPMDPAEPPGSLVYLSVPSIEAAIPKIERAGGKIMMAKEPVGQWGWMAVFAAPGGVVQAIWEANPNARM